MPKCPYVLIVLDGWGMREKKEWNAVAVAKTPNFDRYWGNYPHALVRTDGRFVGLPDGQFGNSEVGHQNLGAGRVVVQTSTRISDAIADGSFFANRALLRATTRAQTSRLHLMGLVSDGGVHSSLEHLFALIELAQREHAYDLYIHAFLDGRDTPPTSGAGYVQRVRELLQKLGFGQIATIMGRYWAMDRDNRWERTERAYRVLRFAEGLRDDGPAEAAVARAYQRGETDEFIKPIVLDPEGAIRDGDAVIFFNFRPDRARQLTRAFTERDFAHFDRGPCPTHRARHPHPVRSELYNPRGLPQRRFFAQHLRRSPEHCWADAVSSGRDRKVRARHVLLQQRPRDPISRGREKTHPLAQGRNIRSQARDVRLRSHRRSREADHQSSLRLRL
jgi:bisphosphoglycerate-independent phosphoglycerate mutase